MKSQKLRSGKIPWIAAIFERKNMGHCSCFMDRLDRYCVKRKYAYKGFSIVIS